MPSPVQLLRFRRGPVLALLVVVGLVGAAFIARDSLRPRLEPNGSLRVPAAYAGTTYAVDGLACLVARSVPVEIVEVQDSTTGGLRTRLRGRPPGSTVTVGFPVPPEAGDSLVGVRVAAGDERCFRVLLTPEQTGERRAGAVSVRVRYGPFGVLRTGLEITPPAVLDVTGTGTDPRARR